MSGKRKKSGISVGGVAAFGRKPHYFVFNLRRSAETPLRFLGRRPDSHPCLLAFCAGSAEHFGDVLPPKYMPPRGPGRISARQRILAQWRGVDLSPLEAAQAVRARRLGDVLPKVAADLHLDTRRAEAEVVKVWNSLIDPNIVAHAQPAGVRKGTLFVNVDSNVWLAEIVRYRRKEILDRLQHSFGKNLIQRISFRVG